MLQDRIARRYALSLMDYAEEKTKLDSIKNDFVFIHETYIHSPELRAVLESPIISPYKKRSILKLLFGNRISETTAKLVELLASKGRAELLDNIAKEFIELYNQHTNRVQVHITSAVALPPAERHQLISRIQNELKSTVEVTETINPELIGGFSIKIGDKLYDGSIAYALRKLKQEFTK